MGISGSYILFIFNSDEFSTSIGKLGSMRFKKGYYAYIGSALNNQLINRVSRHIRKQNKKIHWHIDYFLASSTTQVIQTILIPAPRKEEEDLVASFSDLNYQPIANFGSTDSHQTSHFFFLGIKLDNRWTNN